MSAPSRAVGFLTEPPPITLARVRSLDGWRGVAIASVLLGHFAPNPFVNTGRLGVELFFVLSGRLMAEILFLRATPLLRFFQRRIARVWPAFVVFVVVAWAVSLNTTTFRISGLDAAAALTFTANYRGVLGHRTPFLDHVWSLCIEEHTYFFLALLALAARRRWVTPAVACLVAAGLCIADGVASTILAHQDYYVAYWRTDVRAASILLAAGVFVLSREHAAWLRRLPNHAPLALAAVGCALNFERVPDPVKYSLGTLCLAVAVCLVDRVPSFGTRILEHELFVRLGILSFSCYLWQQPFYQASKHGLPTWVALLGVACCTLTSYFIVERPARDLLNRRRGPAS